MAHYAKKEYWEERYEKDTVPFEWYQGWNDLKSHLHPYVNTKSEILMLGCGSSTMSELMYEDGYKRITNIDFSNVVVEQMKKRNEDKRELKYVLGNVTDMTEFVDQSFDVVIDKATMDSILCGDLASRAVNSLIHEVYRVLKPGGCYIVITYGLPTFRTAVLDIPELGWSVEQKSVPKPASFGSLEKEEASLHYIYVCKKSSA